MENKWEKVSLAEIYEFSSGLSKPRSAFGSGYPFLSFKDVFYNSSVPRQLVELVNSTEQERVRASIKRGDVFLTRTSETMDELGMSCVALADIPDATFNGFTKRLRPKIQERVHPEYARYYFRDLLFRQDVNAMSSMSTRASLNNEMLSRLTIILPPFAEQIVIGNILGTLDDKMELNQKMNETLEVTAQTLFKSWFVNFNGVAPEDMCESEMGLIPKGWRIGQLRDVCTVIGGFAFKSKDFSTEGHPVVKIKNISNSLDVDLQDVDYVPIEIASKASKFHLEDGSLVMAMTGATVGKFGLVLNQSKFMPVLNQRVALFKPKENGVGFLLSALLTTNIYDQVVLRAQGSAQPNISADGIMDSDLILPAREAQVAFSKITNPLFERWIVNKKESLVLKKVRDTLLPKLISGQLRIKDAEKFMESHI